VSEQGTFLKNLDALCERERTAENLKARCKTACVTNPQMEKLFTKASEIF
jgi:hypothetical protein